MRRLIAAVAFLALALPVCADDKDDAAKKLSGTYTTLEVIFDGKSDEKKKEDVKGFVVKEGTMTMKIRDREEKGTFKLDPSKKPAHIDIKPEGDRDVVHGIYQVKETDKGTELTVALAGPGSERPKDFKGEGKDQIVIKLLRKKEK
jgi:uncharacterized protein (TIGR03067 family)